MERWQWGSTYYDAKLPMQQLGLLLRQGCFCYSNAALQDNVLALITSDCRYERALLGIKLLAQQHLGHTVQSLIAWRQHVNDDIKKNYSQNNVVNVQGVCKRVSRLCGFGGLVTAHTSACGMSSVVQGVPDCSSICGTRSNCHDVLTLIPTSSRCYESPMLVMSTCGWLLLALYHMHHVIDPAPRLLKIRIVLEPLCAGSHGDTVLGSSHASAGCFCARLLEG